MVGLGSLITYVVTRAHPYTVRGYLEDWDPALQANFRVVSYEDLANAAERHMPPGPGGGAWIFSDIERLGEPWAAFAGSVARAARAAGCRVLNDPCTVLRRFDLLKALHAAGLNRFHVYAIDDRPRRFPVFVRVANDHDGSRSALLHTPQALHERLAELRAEGWRAADLMTTEYAHAADESGVYRKYSCFLIGDAFVPRHLLFSRNWVTKLSDNIVDASMMREEEAFVETRPNPHEAALRRVFRIANIDYGRVDYGLVDRAIQVWEVNTNPTIMSPPGDVPSFRLALQRRVAARIGEAFRALDAAPARAHP